MLRNSADLKISSKCHGICTVFVIMKDKSDQEKALKKIILSELDNPY